MTIDLIAFAAAITAQAPDAECYVDPDGRFVDVGIEGKVNIGAYHDGSVYSSATLGRANARHLMRSVLDELDRQATP